MLHFGNRPAGGAEVVVWTWPRRNRPERPGSQLDERRRSLLIVDDDQPFRQRLAIAMERRGYAVATAESVAAGIAAARRAGRRPSRWSTSGSPTAAASTW